ncbi:hypothetical protein DFP72DRAFT_887986 [Ephemerocybe angulata]|uniref:Secreted protein n=1 Tax=Ephemerocybe angulata TaxID=980116 RepID=A0A8H6I6A6_9AGAR|nr:hypothetical protein DFP72DRAFT_887986 [Tulosesus angulatus]
MNALNCLVLSVSLALMAAECSAVYLSSRAFSATIAASTPDTVEGSSVRAIGPTSLGTTTLISIHREESRRLEQGGR